MTCIWFFLAHGAPAIQLRVLGNSSEQNLCEKQKQTTTKITALVCVCREVDNFGRRRCTGTVKYSIWHLAWKNSVSNFPWKLRRTQLWHTLTLRPGLSFSFSANCDSKCAIFPKREWRSYGQFSNQLKLSEYQWYIAVIFIPHTIMIHVSLKLNFFFASASSVTDTFCTRSYGDGHLSVSNVSGVHSIFISDALLLYLFIYIYRVLLKMAKWTIWTENWGKNKKMGKINKWNSLQNEKSPSKSGNS